MQHILHAICCSIFYMRYLGESETLNEPIIKQKMELQPGLERIATETYTKEDMQKLAEDFKHQLEEYFEKLDGRLEELSSTDNNLTNMEIVLMETRHISVSCWMS